MPVNPYDYARQRFREAVLRLASGHGSIQERVSAAFHALDTAITHDRVPGEVGAYLHDFAELWRASNDGSIDLWARGLSVDEAVEIATWLLQASYRIEDLWRQGGEQPAALVEGSPALGDLPLIAHPEVPDEPQ